MDAAEKLFAEQGVEAVSVRAINAEAGLAPAAVHYHFGSKDALLDAVLDRRGQAALADIIEHCDRLLEQGGRPDPRDILDAVLSPYLALLERDRVGGARWLAIMGQLTLSRDQRLEPSASPASERLQTLIHQAFPDADPSDLEKAWRLAVETLILLMARTPDDWSTPLEESGDLTLDMLLDFTVGGMAHALRRATSRRSAAVTA
jgi:AcrR family transcriptional regulator